VNTSDDELQKIFRRNREKLLRNKEEPRPLFIIDANYQDFKPRQNFRDFLIENNGKFVVETDEKKTISGRRDRPLEKKIWQQKIQPISDRCLNGEFQYDPCLGVAELTDDSIALVHNKIFQIFNKLIDFPSQLIQIAPPIDQDRQAKDLVLAFDDIVLKKLRAGLGTPEEHELFFYFLQDVYDCKLLPAFLTYLGHACDVSVSASEGSDQQIISPQLEEVVTYIQTIGCRKFKNDDAIQFLEKKNIRFDCPSLSKKQVGYLVSWLRDEDISSRIIALILDWPRIKDKTVKINSVIRKLPR